MKLLNRIRTFFTPEDTVWVDKGGYYECDPNPAIERDMEKIMESVYYDENITRRKFNKVLDLARQTANLSPGVSRQYVNKKLKELKAAIDEID